MVTYLVGEVTEANHLPFVGLMTVLSKALEVEVVEAVDVKEIEVVYGQVGS